MTLLVALVLATCPQDDDKGFLGLHEADLRVSVGDFDLWISGILDLEYYVIDETAPGLLFLDEDSRMVPRLTVFFDATVGEHLYFFAQTRVDRGLDPDCMDSGQVRVDEWFGRYTIEGDDWSLAFQAGKFATPLGNFVPRHDSMHNPFVRAPIVYDHVTTVGDKRAPANNAAQLSQRDIADLKDRWVTMIWGPVYGTGAMLFTKVGKFDARFAVTNTAPSERPSEWDPDNDDWEALNTSLRIGWTPFTGFKVGFNYSYGPYYDEDAEASLPADRDRDDYPQRLIGLDFEYSIGHLFLFAEIYGSDWDAPNISGDLRAIAWYFEAKYRFFPGFYAAARVGQIVYSEIRDASGENRTWDRNSWRVEVAAGYFIYANLLAKVEYEFNETAGPADPDDNVASLSLSLSF